MESSVEYDGAVFGNEETITVEIVQDAIETGTDGSNIIILQPVDSEQQETQVVELEESAETSAPFENIEEAQFVEVPMTLSADDQVNQSEQIQHVVLSNDQQIVRTLQQDPSSEYPQQDLQQSNLIILQPMTDENAVTSESDFAEGGQATYVEADQQQIIGDQQSEQEQHQTGVVEIPEVRYIEAQQPVNTEFQQPDEGAELQQLEHVPKQEAVDGQLEQQAEYGEIQVAKTEEQSDVQQNSLSGEMQEFTTVQLVAAEPEATEGEVAKSQTGEATDAQQLQYSESQADDDMDDDDYDDELQDPSVRNQNSDQQYGSSQVSIKQEPRPHTVEVFKSYDAVLARIAEIEIDTNTKFVREKKNSKIFGQEWVKRPVKNEREFAWCSKNNAPAGGERERLSPEIEFDGIPFINVGYIRLDCNLGSQDTRQTKKQATIERKRKPYASKKIGCPAKIYVSQVTKFPDYRITEDTKRNRHMLLQQLTVDLKYDWENVRAESWYYAKFPTEDDHVGHPLRGEGAGLHVPMDYRVREKVKEWTLQGITSCSQIKALINNFVTEELFPGQPVPPGRRFFPKTKEICNVMYTAKVQQLPPQLDLERIQTVVQDKLTGLNPGDSLHFRPSFPRGHNFLFVYQSEWQKHLLVHYGQVIVYVEPIHKHIQYPLPIYCLIVRTNVGFTIAGMFTLKLVTKPLLTEVFKMFTEWNPEWKPRYLLADFNDENIAGIQENFTDMTVLLTEEYMEEMWRKWIDRKDSGVAKDTEILICMLKAVARAQTQSDFEVALEAFVNSPRYLSVVRLRRWFLAKWLPFSERWADIYKDETVTFIMNGFRGKERHAELLCYICSCFESMKDAPLSKVLGYMVTVLMPELFQDYLRQNIQMLLQKAQREDIPEYLQGRPSELVNHILDRSDPCAFDEGVNIQELGMGNFKVNNHDVDFTRPYCSCTDWQKHNLPCKHFCVIFNHMPGWGWHSLIETYRESPLFAADPFCLEANKKIQERAEVKFEPIEEEDLEAATEVDANELADEDLDEALSTLNNSQQPPHSDHVYDKSDKPSLVKKIESQFQDLTKAVRERKDSTVLLKMINEKLNSVLSVIQSPSKGSASRSPTNSGTRSPVTPGDCSIITESSTPIVYHIKTEKEEQGSRFIYHIKTEKEDSAADDSADIYDPPPIYVPVKVNANNHASPSSNKISIPFESPKKGQLAAVGQNSLAGWDKLPQELDVERKLVLKSMKRKSSEQPTKIYVPFKTPKPLSAQFKSALYTTKRAPAAGESMAAFTKTVGSNSPLKKTVDSASPEKRVASGYSSGNSASNGDASPVKDTPKPSKSSAAAASSTGTPAAPAKRPVGRPRKYPLNAPKSAGSSTVSNKRKADPDYEPSGIKKQSLSAPTESTPGRKASDLTTPVRNGKKCSTDSHSSSTPDPNVRKSSRKSTSIYAGPDRIRSPTSVKHSIPDDVYESPRKIK